MAGRKNNMRGQPKGLACNADSKGRTEKVEERTMEQNITLEHDFSDCERGNTWLVNDDLTIQLAYIRLGQEDNTEKPACAWLEISICTENYPGLRVALVHKTEVELAQHITKECGGMYVRKCNIEGVKVEDGQVVGLDDDEADEEGLDTEAEAEAIQEDKDRKN